MRSLGGFEVLPSVVDIIMLYGSAEMADIQTWNDWSYFFTYLAPQPGIVDGITDTDVRLNEVLGVRLQPPSARTPLSPVNISVSGATYTLAAPTPLPSDAFWDVFGELSEFGPFAWLVPQGTPLSFTFNLTGDL